MRLALLFGDDIGPEITIATRRVVDAAAQRFDIALDWDERIIGLDALFEDGTTFPDETLDCAARADGIILGPVSSDLYPNRDRGGINPASVLRKHLDLFANLRPSRTREAIRPAASNTFDLLMVRENTECFYADLNMVAGHGELRVTEDVGIAMRRITRDASMRIAEEAFQHARTRHGKVTAVHKADVMRETCGLFLEASRHHAAQNPDIAYEEVLIDAMCAQLIRAPHQHDVIVTTNLFGDILSDLTAELSGGLGLGTSLNVGPNHAMAQASHGSAPDIALEDRANPSGLIGSTAMLLHWIGRRQDRTELVDAAAQIETALEHMLSDPRTHTADLGGPLGTQAFTEGLLERILEPEAASDAA